MTSFELVEYLRKRSATEIQQIRIVAVVCQVYRVSLEQVRGPSREQHLAEARHVAMYLLSRLGHLSSVSIGKLFRKKNHTTVLHALKKVDKQMAGRAFASHVQSIIEKINDHE